MSSSGKPRDQSQISGGPFDNRTSEIRTWRGHMKFIEISLKIGLPTRNDLSSVSFCLPMPKSVAHLINRLCPFVVSKKKQSPIPYFFGTEGLPLGRAAPISGHEDGAAHAGAFPGAGRADPRGGEGPGLGRSRRGWVRGGSGWFGAR